MLQHDRAWKHHTKDCVRPPNLANLSVKASDTALWTPCDRTVYGLEDLTNSSFSYEQTIDEGR